MYFLLNLLFTFFIMIGLCIVDFITEELTVEVYFNVELIKNYIKNIFFNQYTLCFTCLILFIYHYLLLERFLIQLRIDTLVY